MENPRKRFADEVMEVIYGELRQVLGDGKKDTESDIRMITCLNRIGVEVGKLGFKS